MPPAALARHADVERRRGLAHALHAPARPRTRRITERLEEMRAEIARFRERAIAVHAKLLELEAANAEVAVLRQTLIDSSVKLEQVVRVLTDTPYPATK